MPSPTVRLSQQDEVLLDLGGDLRDERLRELRARVVGRRVVERRDRPICRLLRPRPSPALSVNARTTNTSPVGAVASAFGCPPAAGCIVDGTAPSAALAPPRTRCRDVSLGAPSTA